MESAGVQAPADIAKRRAQGKPDAPPEFTPSGDEAPPKIPQAGDRRELERNKRAALNQFVDALRTQRQVDLSGQSLRDDAAYVRRCRASVLSASLGSSRGA